MWWDNVDSTDGSIDCDGWPIEETPDRASDLSEAGYAEADTIRKADPNMLHVAIQTSPMCIIYNYTHVYYIHEFIYTYMYTYIYIYISVYN